MKPRLRRTGRAGKDERRNQPCETGPFVKKHELVHLRCLADAGMDRRESPLHPSCVGNALAVNLWQIRGLRWGMRGLDLHSKWNIIRTYENHKRPLSDARCAAHPPVEQRHGAYGRRAGRRAGPWLCARNLCRRGGRCSGGGGFHAGRRDGDVRGTALALAAFAPGGGRAGCVSGCGMGRAGRRARGRAGRRGGRYDGAAPCSRRWLALCGAGGGGGGKLGCDARAGPDGEPPVRAGGGAVGRALVAAARGCRAIAQRRAHALAGESRTLLRPAAGRAGRCAGRALFRYYLVAPAFRPLGPELAAGVGP